MGRETTINKIACAMAECGGPGNSFSELLINGGATPSQVVAVCAHLARAALEALREPDDAMRDAGQAGATQVLDNHGYHDIPGVADLAGTSAYKAMIDAALADPAA